MSTATLSQPVPKSMSMPILAPLAKPMRRRRSRTPNSILVMELQVEARGPIFHSPALVDLIERGEKLLTKLHKMMTRNRSTVEDMMRDMGLDRGLDELRELIASLRGTNHAG